MNKIYIIYIVYISAGDHLRHSQELHNYLGTLPENEINLGKYGKYGANQTGLPSAPYHPYVRGSGTHLVFELLTQFLAIHQQEEHIVEPLHADLRLSRIELHCSLIVQQLIDGNDELVALQIETNGQVLGQIGHQRLHVATLDQLLDGLLLRHEQAVASALQSIQYISYHMKHFIRGSTWRVTKL